MINQEAQKKKNPQTLNTYNLANAVGDQLIGRICFRAGYCWKRL